MNRAASNLAEVKLAACIRLARECSRDSWQPARNPRERHAFRQISREAVADARYWRQKLQNETARRFHVVVLVPRTGEKTYMTVSPVTHAEGCTILSKMTRFPWRQEMLEEAAR